MTDIVAIHGIFMNRGSRAEMLRLWRAAMIRGLDNVRYTGAEEVALECAFYGHLYNDGKAYGDAALQVGDLEPGLEQELFLAIGEAAAAGDEDMTTKLWLPDPFQRAVRAIEGHGIFDGVASAAIRLVKQVGRYFRDPDFAGQVRDELATALETKPRVLIAHSLGSVIAYDLLRREPATSVTTLITIGSPLGFRGIRLALHPELDRTLPPWPSVPAWINIAAIEDAVATVKTLNGRFDGSVEDRAARNGYRTAHSAVRYLQNVQTSNALKSALG